MNVSFDDLEGTLNEGGPVRSAPRVEGWTVDCAKCRGTGRFRSYAGRDVGPCHLCKGTGKLTYKTSPEDRARAQVRTAQRKAVKADTFIAAFPAEWAWMQAATGFDFAKSMIEAVTKYGNLTERQLAAVQKCMASDAKRVEARVERKETAKGIDVSRITTLFAKARESKKLPILRVGGIELASAKPHSKNPGAVYVRRPADDAYLGKIVDGVYMPSFAATAADLELVQEIARDPLALATAHGKATGNCSCCGLELTNPLSIELGIGPICRKKWGI